MRKEVLLFVILLLIPVAAHEDEITVDPGSVPGDFFYSIDTSLDEFRLFLASKEKEAIVASEIRKERLAEAYELAEQGESAENILAVIEDADKKGAIVLDQINPEAHLGIQEDSRQNIEVLHALEEKVPEQALPALQQAIQKQLSQEEKTRIIAQITSSINSLCTKLIQLVGLDQAISEEPRCNPENENAPEWLKEKSENDYKEFDKSAKKKFMKEIKNCQENPRECRCEEIPIKSFSEKCKVIIPEYIKCKESQDQEACMKMESLTKDEMPMDDVPEDLMKEMYEMKKDMMPPECKEAGATERESCEKIMREKYWPYECKEANAMTEESCSKIMQAKAEQYMKERFQGPPECMKDGNFIGEEACRSLMKERYEQEDKQDHKENKEDAISYCQENMGVSREECEQRIFMKIEPEIEQREEEHVEPQYDIQQQGIQQESYQGRMREDYTSEEMQYKMPEEHEDISFLTETNDIPLYEERHEEYSREYDQPMFSGSFVYDALDFVEQIKLK